jgi:hypothetical protein
MEAAGTDLSGHWDLTVHFSSSTSRHRLFIEQDGNWIEGFHQSDFSTQEMAGTIEGGQVKLRSEMRQPGNSMTYLFAGEVSGDAISGSIHLGEYLTAQFTAERVSYRQSRQPVAIPNGPPLAT